MKSKSIGLAFFVLVCSSYGMLAQIPTIGLVAYYPFNQNANDSSGNGNHGTIYSVAPATDRCGVQKKAYEFDGLESEIVVSNSAILDTMTNISLCAWVKPTVSFYGTGNNSIIDKGYYSHNIPYYQYHLGITGDLYPFHPASFAFAVSINNEYRLVQSTSNIWYAGIWYFVAGTHDGNFLRLYINGQIDTIEFRPGIIDHFGEDIHIGKFGNLNAYTPGVFDDIRIYNRALSQDEILILYNLKCQLGELHGMTEVCQGQQNVTFYVDSIDNASLYEWNYSGTGATIHENGNQIAVDFANNATSGTLTVTVTGDSIVALIRSLDIQVNLLPSDAGIISGKEAVCQGDSGVIYQIPAIENATSYSWTYNGSVFPGNSNVLSVDFSADAISGNLIVTGNNSCGDGSASPPFPIAVSQLPSNPESILGESVVCQGQQGVTYSIPVIQNATTYAWNYSGTGVVISGNTNVSAINFSDHATSGNLTVFGSNACGSGVNSPDFSISVNNCAENPSLFNIPNSFSPDGDGVNDVFFIRGLTNNSTLIIYDRLGKKLFETSNYQNDWDGKDNKGNILESDTYWYVFYPSGYPSELKGFIYLKR